MKNLYIGKIQNDGVVKYIAIPYKEQYQDIPRILKTFYSTDARTDALLNLGNLVTLQPSPYKRWSGYNDKVNCRAEIRDDGEKKGKHLPQFADTLDDYARLNAFLFLFQDGHWHFNTQNGFEDLATAIITFSDNQDVFKGINLFELSENGEMDYIGTSQFTDWKNVYNKAISENKTYYVFRGDKLITTVNHPLNQ
ncbi:hypothetical protein [Bacteroides fragilis]|uniref:hypothetical protein n=1 Tax=Bacteroides fragilis TaxID=817 RepID=UPI00189D2A76|nr:hypothetical protein [Bacteroides fragilis]